MNCNNTLTIRNPYSIDEEQQTFSQEEQPNTTLSQGNDYASLMSPAVSVASAITGLPVSKGSVQEKLIKTLKLDHKVQNKSFGLVSTIPDSREISDSLQEARRKRDDIEQAKSKAEKISAQLIETLPEEAIKRMMANAQWS
jgi:hypothetical protein